MPMLRHQFSNERWGGGGGGGALTTFLSYSVKVCILLKFDSAKFRVSDLCFSNVIKEKPLRGLAGPPLLKEGLKGLLGSNYSCFTALPD